MPCHSCDIRTSPSDHYKEEADKVTRILCALLTHLEKDLTEEEFAVITNEAVPELDEWWGEHQLADRVRKEEEKERRKAKAEEKAAKAKLTPRERKLLGLE